MVQRFLGADLIAAPIVELVGSAFDVNVPARLNMTIVLNSIALCSPAELRGFLRRQRVIQWSPVPFMLGPGIDLLGRLYAPLRLRNSFLRHLRHMRTRMRYISPQRLRQLLPIVSKDLRIVCST